MSWEWWVFGNPNSEHVIYIFRYHILIYDVFVWERDMYSCGILVLQNLFYLRTLMPVHYVLLYFYQNVTYFL